MCLMLYNDFLCPSINQLETSLRDSARLNFDLQVNQFRPDDSTKGRFDTKNWFLHCLKETKDPITQQFLKKYFNWPSSAILFSGHSQSYDACNDLTCVFKQCYFKLYHIPRLITKYQGTPSTQGTPLNPLPFVPQTNSDVLKVSHFLNAVLTFFKLAISPGKTHLSQLQVGAKATWQDFIELSELYTLIIQKFPIKTQELLMASRPFYLYTRDYNKLNFNLLPQITIPPYLIELRNGIYNFRTGKFTKHSENTLTLISCSSFWPEITFPDLPNV